MDPLTGLSLACNVMQIIQFSAETLAIFKRLKEGGSPDPYVEGNSQSLVTATTKLRSTLNIPSVVNGIPRDASLLQVCNEVVLIADELQKQIQKSLPIKGESKAKMLRKSVAFQLKYKSATEKLSRQLDNLQHRMESEILIELRHTLTQNHSDLVDRLRALDKDLIAFHTSIIAGQTLLKDLVVHKSGEVKNAIVDEAQRTRDYNAEKAQETKDLINAKQSERISDAAYQKFLGSFRFPGINARRNTIEISHPDTFEWIFAEPRESQGGGNVPKWSSFPAWLRGRTGLYWISGKAGAGKSTLMKFLLEDKRTRRIISENSPDTMIVSAFIWSLGSSMQKTLRGVLCTLLYDIFAQDREICWRQMRERQGGFDLKQESSDWSLEELVLLLSTTAENCPRTLCIFIDGLDEIDRSKPTEITRLMKWLKSARNLSNMQICVSSRPEPTFDSRLREHPHLRVQDLTAKDIEHYVSGSLRKLEFDFPPSPHDIQDLIDTIVYRAEGVFLWAHLVVEHIRTDTEYSPTWKRLVQRVEELPSGLHSMYETMWERYNGDSDLYRAETASYLNYLLYGQQSYAETNSLLGLMLRFNAHIQDMIFRGDTVSIHLLVEECSRFDVNIVARCGGLVTTSGIPPPQLLSAWMEGQMDLEDLIFRNYIGPSTLNIGFGHRSAADFLLSTSAGHRILRYDRISAVEHAVSQAKTYLCHSILTGWMFSSREAMYTLSPTRREFRHPQFTSAAFDLLVESHRRRPRWIKSENESQQQEYVGLNVHIATDFVLAGFREPLHKRLQHLPTEELYIFRKQLLSSICESESSFGIDSATELLNFIRPEDISDGTPSFLYTPLVKTLLSYAEGLLQCLLLPGGCKTATGHECRQFVELLLDKCGGIECLSKWRVLVMLPCWLDPDNLLRRSSLQVPLRVNTHIHNYLDGEQYATLVETGFLDIFCDRGSPLQKYLGDRLRPHRKPCIQKLIMAVYFTRNQSQIFGVKLETFGDLTLTMELHEVIEKLQTLGKSDPHNLFTEEVFALFHASKSGEHVGFSSEKSLEFLIEKGYISHVRVDHANPLRGFTTDEIIHKQHPSFDEIDWSFEIDCKPLKQVTLIIIEREQKAGNLKAFAPCDGGMEYWKALEAWRDEEL